MVFYKGVIEVMIKNTIVKWEQPIGGYGGYEGGYRSSPVKTKGAGFVVNTIKGGFFSPNKFIIQEDDGTFSQVPISWCTWEK